MTKTASSLDIQAGGLDKSKSRCAADHTAVPGACLCSLCPWASVLAPGEEVAVLPCPDYMQYIRAG